MNSALPMPVAAEPELPVVDLSDELAIVPVAPVPEDAPPFEYRHPKHGVPTSRWAYHAADGCVAFWVCRWDFTDADGKPDKLVLPVSYCELGDGRTGWAAKAPPETRPLYNLRDILARSEAPVLVVEGEKTADAATSLFPDFVVTTSSGGCLAARKSDWSPVIGRHVQIWPDNDEPGARYAEEVASLSLAAGAAEVGVVPVPPEWPTRWDLADQAPDGADLRALLDQAVVVEPQPPQTVTHMPPGYTFSDDGLYWRDPFDPDRPAIFLAGPFRIEAKARDSNGESWGRLLSWEDDDGEPHNWVMPLSMTADDGIALVRVLLDGGLTVAQGRKARELLTKFLASFDTEARARVVHRIGWHDRAFVLPNEVIGETAGERVVLQGADSLKHAFHVRGSLSEWQEDVARPCLGNSRLMFALSAAFAPPLLALTGAESGGFHFRGHSSIGKSTALMVAGSAWGGGGLRGYSRSWRATDNALEGVAQSHCDALLCLDELSEIEGKDAGRCAYMLANGVGKSRASRTGQARTSAEWRVLFLSSGEISVADKVAEDRRNRIFAGQEVRVVDIPAAVSDELGLFEDIHGFESSQEFADHLRRVANEYYGIAAREFVREVAADPAASRSKVSVFVQEFVAEHVPPGAHGQLARVAARFGLVAAAGELAIALDILPWTKDDAIEAAAQCMRAWLDQRGGTAPAEIADGIAQLRRFIELHGESRFSPMDVPAEGCRTINRAGFRRRADGGGFEYFVLSEAWRTEIFGGRDTRVLNRAFVERGILLPDDGRKPQSRHRLPGLGPGPVRCYHVASTILEGEDA